MSTIPTSVTEEQFEEHIRPYLLTARRGYDCKIELYKIFNYILKRLYTGCQWSELPIASDPTHPEKKKSVGKRSTIIDKNEMRQGVFPVNELSLRLTNFARYDCEMTSRMLTF